MHSLWKALLGMAVVAAASCGLTLFALSQHADEAHLHDTAAEEPASGVTITKPDEDDFFITLTDEAHERLAIETAPLVAITWRPHVIAYGRLIEEPAETFVVRAPFAGTLRSGAQHWPALGTVIQQDDVLARLEPRVSPGERIDLLTRLSVAQGEESEAESAAAAARTSYEQKRKLNEANQIVSNRQLEEAQVHYQAESAKLERARETVNLMQAALAAQSGPAEPMSLSAPRGGTITDISARPGEAVEAGHEVFRVARFDPLIARIALTPGDDVDTSAAAVRIRIADFGRDVAATWTAIIPSADAPPVPTALLRVQNNNLSLHPGMSLTAWLPAIGAERAGVDVPRAAVVRTDGRAWIYIQKGEHAFERRPIPTDAPTPGGWFVSLPDLKPDARVVIVGTDGLLSEELKHAIEQEEAAAGE